MEPKASVAGLTLIETLVVMAIVAVVALIGVPVFQQATVYTRQKEAKMRLAQIYAAETAMLAEWTTYTLCLRQIGYRPDIATVAGSETRYFRTGFIGAPVTATCGDTATVTCLRWDFTPGRTQDCASPADTVFNENTGDAIVVPGGVQGSVSRFAFTAIAAGVINRSTNRTDIWSMTQAKVLTHVQLGF